MNLQRRTLTRFYMIKLIINYIYSATRKACLLPGKCFVQNLVCFNRQFIFYLRIIFNHIIHVEFKLGCSLTKVPHDVEFLKLFVYNYSQEDLQVPSSE